MTIPEGDGDGQMPAKASLRTPRRALGWQGKWIPQILPETWPILFDLGSLVAMTVYVYLAHRADRRTGSCPPTTREKAALAVGASERAVSTAYRKLEKAGL